jgi:hypothetical protein
MGLELFGDVATAHIRQHSLTACDKPAVIPG